jgi:hypothetical protein
MSLLYPSAPDIDQGGHGPSEDHAEAPLEGQGSSKPPTCRVSESGSVFFVTQAAIGDMADPIDSAL